MAKLMGRIRISFNTCQITFKTRIGLKHMKRGGGVKDRFERVFVFCIVAGWDQCGETKHTRAGERRFTLVMSVTRLSSL